MFVRLSGLGSNGVVHDTVGEALATGTFTDALNVRFTGTELQKMLEPEAFALTQTVDSAWMQAWSDGLTTYLAVADGSNIWLYYDNGIDDPSWINASRSAGYNTQGYWDSFAWGDTCVFNNGIDPPQIFNANTAKFEDLPRWGVISSADDILNNREPSVKVQASCVRIVPYKSFLVAVGVTESGLYQPNKVWWSDSTSLAGYAGVPNWDYETPASLSGQIVVNPEGGAIRTAAVLNEQLIIYTDVGATAQQVVGGSLVMQFRRLFNKGAAGLHCVAEFNNQHFCISQDQLYLHDGSSVRLFAKDRVEEEFFKRIGKGGRYGNGEVDWDGLQVVKDADRKEIIVAYNRAVKGMGSTGGGACVPVQIDVQPQDGNQGDPGATVTFGVTASGTAPIAYQWFENELLMDGETNKTLVVPDTSTSLYYVIVSNDCGSAQSDVVTVVPAETCVPVSIYTQPSFTDNGDGTMTATVVAGGTETITYQWEQDNAGDNVFTEMGGETTDTVTVPDTSANQYRVVVTNACGTETSVAIIPSCVVTVPNTDIPSISIWDETDGDARYYLDGVVAVHGNEIIAAPGGRRIIHSTNLGDAWIDHPLSLPDDPANPGDAYHLVPTKWQWIDGVWWAHMKSVNSNAGNNNFYVGSTADGGATWTIGNTTVNDRYSSSSFYIEGNNLVSGGRPATPNNVQIAKYGDRWGVDYEPLNTVNISYNSNSNWLEKFGDGYLSLVAQTSPTSYAAWHINSDSNSAYQYTQWSSSNTNTRRCASNDGGGVVVFGMPHNNASSNTISMLTDDMASGDPVKEIAIDPALSWGMSVAYKPNIWLTAIRSPDTTSKWSLSYSLDEQPTAMIYPCDVILPDNHTSSGTNGNAFNVEPASGGWWVGWYRKATDQRVRIFKFEFETYTGNCVL